MVHFEADCRSLHTEYVSVHVVNKNTIVFTTVVFCYKIYMQWNAHTLVHLLSFSKCMNLCNPSFYHGVEYFCHSRKFPHALSQSVPCLHSPEGIIILNFFLTTDYQLFENFTQMESFAVYLLCKALFTLHNTLEVYLG